MWRSNNIHRPYCIYFRNALFRSPIKTLHGLRRFPCVIEIHFPLTSLTTPEEFNLNRKVRCNINNTLYKRCLVWFKSVRMSRRE